MRLTSIFNVLFISVAAYLPFANAAGLSDETLRKLPDAGEDFNIHQGGLLAPILRTRTPGSEGSLAVLNHFVDFFRDSLPEWKIDIHNASFVTPVSEGKEVPFRNFIATRDPPWAKKGEVGRLSLVAHYDSKLTPRGFIGAIDSAAPCAMLMHLARTIDKSLTYKWNLMKEQGVDSMSLEAEKGIQILLLDGEEAFKVWNDRDSIYGARALAEDWENTYHPAASTYPNELSSISLFVLLDLLGDKGPTIPSYFKTTHWAYRQMAELETRLRKLEHIRSSPNHPAKRALRPDKPRRREPMFLFEKDKADDAFRVPFVGDDHVPFMARGVPVLHLIPTPFPHVWHTMDDDGEHLDLETVEDWTKIVTAFAAEWMELEGHFDAEPLNSRQDQHVNMRSTGKSEL